jgi:diguanylate cyclase (GGDEF)-like protein
MIDIDNFKKYNDTLGHQKGDQAIKKVAHLLDSSSRKSDFVCRYGGEEFCVIMTGIDKSDAKMIAERLREKVEDSFKNDDSTPEELKLTVSLGLATFPYDGSEKKDLIQNADLALYHAKQSGKNRTCQYPVGT